MFEGGGSSHRAGTCRRDTNTHKERSNNDEGLLIETRKHRMCAYVHTCAYQVMLFTYTDKDGYIPPGDRADGSGGGSGGLTTGGGGPFSYLGEAVTNMPRKTATSSLETTTTTTTTVPGGGGGVGGGGARVGVSETAAVIQTHLAREDKIKVRKTTYDRV